MSASISINTNHISYGVVYTVDYACTKPPYDIDLTIQVDDSIEWNFKTIKSGITASSGSLTFSLTASEIITVMSDGGYPYEEHTVTGIQVSVFPQNIDDILNGHYAETDWLTIDALATNCGAPTTVTINGSSSAVTTTASTATLAWSGATGGTNNSIAGYYITYSDSTDGSTWDEEFEYGATDFDTTSGSGSMTVDLPSAGTYRKFFIYIFGTAGKEYGASGAVSPVVYRSPSLPVIFNGTQLTKIIYNGTTISSLVYNGTKLF